MPCTAPSRNNLGVMGPCGIPDVYASGLCKPHWQMANGLVAGNLPAYVQAVLNDSPRGYWRLGESVGTVAADSSSPPALPGTYTGGFTLAQPGAKPGDTAVTLNGTTGYIAVPDNNLLDLGDTFTLECWIKPAGTGTRMLLDKGLNAYQWFLDAGMGLQLWQNGVGSVLNITTPVPIDSNWHHCVVTKTPTTGKVYVDGVDVTNVFTNRAFADNALALGIGASSGGGSWYSGGLDEVAVYATALSPARVLAHFQA